jgi:integrase
LLMALEVNPKIVADGMGHSTTDQTMNTYSHVLPTMQKGAAEKLEALLYG